MSERDGYEPGEFSWVSLANTDVDGAAEFYGDLLGWEHEPVPHPDAGGYGFFKFNGKRVAGVGSSQPGEDTSAWLGYVAVADADEIAGKVTDAGGTVVAGPMDLPNEAGRIAVCRDPEGAFFGLQQLGGNRGAELVNEIGSWTWNQLASKDLDAARKFYGAVFGWTLQPSPEAPPDSPYEMWQVAGQRWEEGLAGAMSLDELPGAPPHWMAYFCVESADGAIEKTKAAGGQLMFGPQEIPVGKLAVFTDPQGGAFAIIEPDYPEPR